VSREFSIAVVDDDERFRTALVESLSSLGYDARGFGSAEQFIAADAAASCDCVITDIHMPGMSGLDLKRLLVARDFKVPVIMITARSEPELEATAAAAGAVCLLRKPFASEALIRCLDKALNIR
jgi:FixJ family two-component response regulator